MRKSELKLLPGEELVFRQVLPIQKPSQRIPALEALLKLLKARSVDEIGKTGPLMASTATSENSEVKDLRLYEVFFVRDALYAAEMLMSPFPLLLRTTLVRTAELLGVRYDWASEEEPGRPPHEVRDPEDSIARELTEQHNWGWPYYGAVDNAGHFVSLLVRYVETSEEGAAFLNYEYQDRRGERRTMFEALSAALGWMERRREKSRVGFIESLRSNPKGHRNQVWMDSWDSYFHSDGSLSNSQDGVSSIEVQVVAYDAFLLASKLFSSFRMKSRGRDFREAAQEIKRSVIKHLWIESDRHPYFALGGDYSLGNREFRPFQVRKSNMGHLLNSKILETGDAGDARRVALVVETLHSEQMMASSGIRTCSKEEFRFRPGAYHNGSVWPWENYFIAQGLRRHGYHSDAQSLEEKIINLVNWSGKYPEFARGGDGPDPELNNSIVIVKDKNAPEGKNKVEQPPQEIQAWTVAAVLAIEGQ